MFWRYIMLPYERRIKKEGFELIRKVFKRSYNSLNFSLKVAYSTPKKSCFAVVVPSLVSKKATVRNKLRRRVKALILRHIDNFKDNCANIVYIRKNAADVSSRDTEKELLDLFYKSGIFKK